MTAIIPGGAGLMAWFLAMIGDAKDYKDESGKQMSDFAGS